MSVEVKGVKELTEQLNRKFGINRMREIEDEALKEGGDYIAELLAKNFKVFEDTGASINEITRTDPFYSKSLGGSDRSVLIKWVGPMERYRIIHLNEHGYTRDGKKYTPRGFGVIAKSLESGKNIYRKIIVDSLRSRI
ncbi:hypothetical protein MT340_009055 [Staphylococcus sp. NRL 16/872]|uniref:hypothetical protein n=1 Tax=Staphylococcus sp. NRL 16/872 TaxID=2930131 RepID=UPI001FB42E33|nr:MULTISPECIES: hypothetical protein [unclassified Staphylococcus]MCJ1656695.1 hypothetical protein [Staphylococcus sp. NRL 21/187]MCJ1662447.1 hypothetical protein [Staphylococcus sp. NRL 18/288]WEN68754.1 hypothetical protein MT340_009055 [Staphylococcus sp. NRL 16/872]